MSLAKADQHKDRQTDDAQWCQCRDLTQVTYLEVLDFKLHSIYIIYFSLPFPCHYCVMDLPLTEFGTVYCQFQEDIVKLSSKQ